MSHGDKAKVSVESSQMVETLCNIVSGDTVITHGDSLLGCSFLTLWLLKGPKAKLKHRI